MLVCAAGRPGVDRAGRRPTCEAEPVGAYADRRGVPHLVALARDEADRWCVLDVVGATGRVVERLRGWNDVLGQALAVADDYLRAQRAFAAGERARNPMGRPLDTWTVRIARGPRAVRSR